MYCSSIENSKEVRLFDEMLGHFDVINSEAMCSGSSSDEQTDIYLVLLLILMR